MGCRQQQRGQALVSLCLQVGAAFDQQFERFRLGAKYRPRVQRGPFEIIPHIGINTVVE